MSWTSGIEVAANTATIVTAISVIFAVWQIRLTQRLAQTNFEDELTQQYREIIRGIPVQALLNQELDEDTWQETFDDFYRYVDLSNEEVFLRLNQRVSAETWKLWQEGIKRHLERPAFKRAWESIKKQAPDDFKELQMVEEEGFNSDPVNWNEGWESKLTKLKRTRRFQP